MLIGIDGSRAFVEERTGTENYSFQLLKALAKIDVKNHYLIYLRKGQGGMIKGERWPENFKFKVVNFPRLWTQVGLAIRTFVDPIDILFIPSHTLPLIRRPGLKTVLTVHDLGAEYLPGVHQLKQLLYLKLMTHYQLKTATKLIAVSKATKNDIITRVGVDPLNIEVVYEGVGEGFSMQYAESSMKYGKSKIDIQNDIVKRYDLESEKYFLFVGTVQPRKNLGRLIKAFGIFVRGPVSSQPQKWLRSQTRSRQFSGRPDSLPPQTNSYKLIIVGQKGWKSDSIYELPKELGIEDNVQFIGRVSDTELAAFYKSALALTYPSLFEGFGLPILEAFSSGCPVITSNVSSMPEVAGDGALLVDPLNVEDIASAMLKIFQDDKFRDSMIRKGYKRARQFSWAKCAKETLEVILKTG